jgi:hypothetical protein
VTTADNTEKRSQKTHASQLADFSLENGVEIPGLVDPNDSVKQYMRVGCLLAPLFKKFDAVEIDSFRIQRIKRVEYQANREASYEAKYYVFSQV